TRSQHPAIRGKQYGRCPAHCYRAFALKGYNLLPCRGIPEFHRAVASPGGQQLAVGREGAGLNRASLLGQTHQLLPPPDIPQPYFPRALGPIPGARSAGQDLAVGREGHTSDGLLVSLEEGDLLLGLHIPKADRLVVAARREHPAVGGEREAPDVIAM